MSYCRKVFRAFFFLLGWVLVAACRIVWCGVEASLRAFHIEVMLGVDVKLLIGAIRHRGCAIGTVGRVVLSQSCRTCEDYRTSFGRAKTG